MNDEPLMQFRARVAARRADVRILAGRVEWTLRGRGHITDVVPITAISSISVRMARFSTRKVVVNTDENAVEFRVAKSIAEQVDAALVQLVAQRPRPGANAVTPTGQGSIAEELINIKWLLDVGVLTRPDFDERRARLLGF